MKVTKWSDTSADVGVSIYIEYDAPNQILFSDLRTGDFNAGVIGGVSHPIIGSIITNTGTGVESFEFKSRPGTPAGSQVEGTLNVYTTTVPPEASLTVSGVVTLNAHTMNPDPRTNYSDIERPYIDPTET